MAAPKRAGFTLVELLVVIIIIALLVALLLPAINSARSAARQTQCMNNQKELGQAVLQYHEAHDRFPGYLNRAASVRHPTTGDEYPLSWVTVILPYMGRGDIWELFQPDAPNVPQAYRDTDGDGLEDSNVWITGLVCPDDLQDEHSQLSYVANCGWDDIDDPDDDRPYPDYPANGIFQDHYNYTESTPVRRVEVRSNHIKDGAQHTLLLSENIQAYSWRASDWLAGATTAAARSDAAERYGGMIWMVWRSGGPPVWAINQNKNGSTRASDRMYARPSSNHAGGVIGTFCDGHVMFIRDSIDTRRPIRRPTDYPVYALLLSPDNRNAKDPGSPATALPSQYTQTPLTADMYK